MQSMLTTFVKSIFFRVVCSENLLASVDSLSKYHFLPLNLYINNE